ncbi:hypothetical protein KAT24_00295 [Candidatus Pacearchaeota archaeon]|nr:hypothetical protein [Candidatus Pacearchaeota archaeon]
MGSDLERGLDQVKEILRRLTRSKYQEYRDAGVEIFDGKAPMSDDEKRELRNSGVEVY